MTAAALLARIAPQPVDVDERSLDDATTSAVLRLFDDGYITSVSHDFGYATYTATADGQRQVRLFTAAAIANAAGNHPQSSGDVALWAWLLLHGGQVRSYDTEPGLTEKMWHLLTCGLDIAKSGAVRDDAWTVWGGTFGDDGREAGVAGRATCQCGTIRSLEVYAKVESVTDLLRQTLTLG